MNIQSQALDDHQVKLSVEFEPGALESYKQRAARQLANRIRVPGFRPGKAPYHVVLRQVGDAALTEEAIELLVNDRYPKIIEESGIHPYSSGQLDKVASMEPLVLDFVVPLEPEVILGDYKSIRRPYELGPITDADIDEVIENLRDRQAILEPADRPAEEGDVVSVHLSGTRLNPSEDQPDSLVEERSYQFLVRREAVPADDEWPFVGFSHNLVGLSTGAVKVLMHEFGPDYPYESMRGVQATYHLVVEDIKSRLLPEINEEFIKSIGEYADLDALKADIRASLEQQALDNYNQIYDDAILDELVNSSTIKFPPEMLDSEVNTVVDNFKHRLEQQGSELDLYLKTREMDLDGLKAEAKPVAEERLKRSLALLELAKAENIQVSEADLQKATMQTLQSLNQSLSPEDARRLTDERIMNNLVGNVMLEQLTRQSEERLRDIASGKFIPAAETETAETESTPEAEGEPVLAGEQPIADAEPTEDLPVDENPPAESVSE